MTRRPDTGLARGSALIVMLMFGAAGLALFVIYRLLVEYWPWLLVGAAVGLVVFLVVPTVAEHMSAPAVVRGGIGFLALLSAVGLACYLLVSTGSWQAPVTFLGLCLAILVILELVVPTVAYNVAEQRRRRRTARHTDPVPAPARDGRVPAQRPQPARALVDVADDLDALGWDAWAAVTPLTVIDEQDDPGNPGETLVLYAIPAHPYGTATRVVRVTDASPSKDGLRHRYGLPVPADFVDAVEAVASTWGVTRAAYSGLVKGT